MDRETQRAAEFQALRKLCDESASREERQNLVQSLGKHVFTEPEHQVVYESIRSLLSLGPISMTRLRVHLNNRGFPDADVEKYFQPESAGHASQAPTDKVTS